MWQCPIDSNAKSQIHSAGDGSGASTQDPETVITDVYECSSFLLRKWRGKRGPSHRAPLQACHDASADKKPISSVRRAFALAARQAGILVGQ
ncbi:DUF982 domain-containing protein [Mesorhizobium shonense]|uniref:DUF982 domain-containing protein n=1 Tax=Mesorhizobium sp. TaxID=1871066 RepID=UPI00339352E9